MYFFQIIVFFNNLCCRLCSLQCSFIAILWGFFLDFYCVFTYDTNHSKYLINHYNNHLDNTPGWCCVPFHIYTGRMITPVGCHGNGKKTTTAQKRMDVIVELRSTNRDVTVSLLFFIKLLQINKILKVTGICFYMQCYLKAMYNYVI